MLKAMETSDNFTFQDIDLEHTINKKKLFREMSLNLEYMNERANSSLFVSKYLNDDDDNILNDQSSFDKLMQIIENIKKDCKKMSSNNDIVINYYDLGYKIGVLTEQLPNNYKKTIINIRNNLIKKDWDKIIEYLDNIVANF